MCLFNIELFHTYCHNPGQSKTELSNLEWYYYQKYTNTPHVCLQFRAILTIPYDVIQRCMMSLLAIYCKDTNDIGVVVVVLVAGLSDSNTTPGYTTLLCFALDCGNFDLPPPFPFRYYISELVVQQIILHVGQN